MTSRIIVDNIQTPALATALNVNAVASSTSRYIRQAFVIVDSTDRSTSTTWTAGSYFGPYEGFRAGSLLRIYYAYPCRNDSTSWGGLYFEPQLRFNNGTWITLGSRGHDAVMDYAQAAIGHTTNCMLYDPGLTTSFDLELRFYYKSYDGTVGLNNALGHDMNATSGTATLMSGSNGLQHYGHWIIEELALFAVQ